MQNVVFFKPQIYMKHSKTGQFYTFVIINGQSFISQSLKTAGPLGEKFDF